MFKNLISQLYIFLISNFQINFEIQIKFQIIDIQKFVPLTISIIMIFMVHCEISFQCASVK